MKFLHGLFVFVCTLFSSLERLLTIAAFGVITLLVLALFMPYNAEQVITLIKTLIS